MARGKAQAPGTTRANDFHGKLSSGVVCYKVLFASGRSFGQPQSIPSLVKDRKGQMLARESAFLLRVLVGAGDRAFSQNACCSSLDRSTFRDGENQHA